MANFKNDPDATFLQNWYSQMVGASGGDDAFAERAAKYVKGGEVPDNILQGAFMDKPFTRKLDIGNGVTGNSLKNTLSMTKDAIKANPWASAGLGAMGIANIAGLVDDDKIGGQLVGGLAGSVIPSLMGASPMATIAWGLGGGTLGSLYDKLRAKKEAEQNVTYPSQMY